MYKLREGSGGVRGGGGGFPAGLLVLHSEMGTRYRVRVSGLMRDGAGYRGIFG